MVAADRTLFGHLTLVLLGSASFSLLSVAQVDVVQSDDIPEARIAAEEATVASHGAPGNGDRASHAAAAPSRASAAVLRSSSTQPGSRPYIPQVDMAQLLDTLLGDPEKTLKDNTLLGSALVTDGELAAWPSSMVAPSCNRSLPS